MCSLILRCVQGGDNSVERVLTVAVLHLLAADGPYSAAVHDILDRSDVWAAYRDQRHDLFLPAGDSSKVSKPIPSRLPFQQCACRSLLPRCQIIRDRSLVCCYVLSTAF